METLTQVQELVKTVLDRFKESRNKNPKRVFVYRNGGSEGEQPMVNLKMHMVSFQMESLFLAYAIRNPDYTQSYRATRR